MERPILHYPGAKWRLAPWICNQLPPHVSYLEPYFGSGAVFFHKPPSTRETINDVDGQVVEFFRVARERPEELARLIALTPWSRAEYYEAYTHTGDPLEDARRFAVRMWMARGARANARSGWRHDVQGRQGADASGRASPNASLRRPSVCVTRRLSASQRSTSSVASLSRAC